MSTYNAIFKSAKASPQFFLDDKTGEILDSTVLLSELSYDVKEIHDAALFTLRTEKGLLNLIDQYEGASKQPAKIGADLNIKMPEFLVQKRATGESRRERLFRYNVVTMAKSWMERIKASMGTSGKYVSQGWKRTADPSPPSWDSKPSINLGACDAQYAEILNNPFIDGEIILRMIINRRWVKVVFNFDTDRFSQGFKVALPIIYLDNESPVFCFSVEYLDTPVKISEKYVIGVDVGIDNYAAISVVNCQTKKVVYYTTLDQREHSLANSIKASSRQVIDLHRKNRPCEARLHRAKNVRKKKEMATITAQRLAELSHIYDNAPVVFENLSWIKNTMQNGRWNRGELVKWSKHFVGLNGGIVTRVSAFKTSQNCYLCGNQGYFKGWKTFCCDRCGIEVDRDESASANIAFRYAFSEAFKKSIATRKLNKRLVKQQPIRTAQQVSRDYPKKDRTKNCKTNKRTKKRKKTFSPDTATLVFEKIPQQGSVVSDVRIEAYADNSGTPRATVLFNDTR